MALDTKSMKFVEVDPTGRYGRYDDVLGKGAFKTVYRAFDEVDGIEVAWNQVKVQDVLKSPEDLERLYSEVHLLKTLKHKNIIKFYNSWVDTKTKNVNFITEIFTSGTLRQYRKKHKHVDIKAVKNWSRQILRGLLYLHSHDPPIIHRDLKCDNIFVNGNQGEVKIGDLGLAAILRQAHAAHSVIGTPEFMAPELYEEEYNELVDIYSFGMCLLEMVTFEYPYSECTNAAQIYKKVTSGKKPAALEKLKDPEVRAFVDKCLAAASVRLPARELLMDPFLQCEGDREAVECGPSLLIAKSRTDDMEELGVIFEDPVPSMPTSLDSYSKRKGVGNSSEDKADVASTSRRPPLLSVGQEPQTEDDLQPRSTRFETEKLSGEKERARRSSRDFRVKGKRGDDDTIFLRLRIADHDGEYRNIHFPFNVETDTAMSVASEMVAELDLSDQDVTTIAEMIDVEILALVPEWKPGVAIDDTGATDGETGGPNEDGHAILQDESDPMATVSSEDSLIELQASSWKPRSFSPKISSIAVTSPPRVVEGTMHGRFEEVKYSHRPDLPQCGPESSLVFSSDSSEGHMRVGGDWEHSRPKSEASVADSASPTNRSFSSGLKHTHLAEEDCDNQRPSNIVLEDRTERFGVGLTSTDVVSVEDILKDSGNMGNINPTLGSNFPTETIMKIVRIIHFCLQPNDVHQQTMSYVIDEINGALILEEGLKAEEGAMKIEIPPYASCASIETLKKFDWWRPIVDEKSTSDCSEIGQKRSTVALVDINPKGKRQQQPQTIFTQSHGSRSSEGDSVYSSSDHEMPSASKKESLSPQPELFGTITSIEGVPNLPTMRKSSIMVASRKNNEGNVELLFKDAENMTQVVGVGLEWAKVVVTKELDVEVREIGEHAWKGLWEDQGCEKLELIEIILPEPETKVGGSLNTKLEDQIERFGIGLTKSDVIGVYAENHLEQLNEGFFPLVYDLVEYMGFEGENSIKCRQVSGGEGGSSKGAAKVRCSTEKSRGKQNVHQDPSQDPPEDGSQDGFQGPPQGPSEPLFTLPLDMEEKKVLLVSIIPLWGYLSHGLGGQEIHDGHELYKATIVPVLKFMFEVDGGHRKITTTLILTCDLGEGGGPNVNPGNLGYFQDNITISLHCEMDRAATLLSRRVENVEIVKRTTTTNASSSYKWGCKGEILLPFLGIQAGGGDGQTTERGSSFAHEISVPQLSSFYVTSKCRGSSLVYNFLYPEEVQARIADDKQGPRELITSEIGGTFEPTIVGEWDGLDQSRKCNYIFKTQRDIISIEVLRQSHGSGQEPECIKQQYELPLWVNHSMTHILRRHEIKELRAPKVNILKHVIGAKPALLG
ncbi:unnamed protein product [Sphagnum compactum]